MTVPTMTALAVNVSVALLFPCCSTEGSAYSASESRHMVNHLQS